MRVWNRIFAGKKVRSPDPAALEMLEAVNAGDLEKVKSLLKSKRALATCAGDRRVTPLHIAARKGHKQIAELLLAYRADVNAKDVIGNTPLHNAACWANYETAELLLANGADLKAKIVGASGPTPIQAAENCHHHELVKLLRRYGDIRDAIQIGCLERVQALLAKKPGLMLRADEKCATPLHFAAQFEQPDIAGWLLANNADVNARKEDGETPLHIAANSGSCGVLRVLLANKANVNAKSNYGNTPLHLAAGNGHKDVVALLLDHQADACATNRDGVIPLTWAQAGRHTGIVALLRKHGGLHDAIEGDYLERVKYLLAGDPPLVNQKNRLGETPLQWALRCDKPEILKVLLISGADVNGVSFAGNTALHRASAWGPTDVIKLLLLHKASVDARNLYGETPLHLASRQGRCDAIDLLLTHGADPNAKYTGYSSKVLSLLSEDDGTLRQEVATREAHFEIATGNGSNVQPSDPAVFLKKDSYWNSPKTFLSMNPAGATPMHIAAKCGRNSAVKLLISRGADVNASDSILHTPLCYAAASGHVETIELLLAHKACAFFKGWWRKALDVAERHGHEKVVEEVLRRHGQQFIVAVELGNLMEVREQLGTDPSLVFYEDLDNRTPLHLAARYGNQEVVELLLANDADVNADYIYDLDDPHYRMGTPLKFALDAGKSKVAELLREHGGLL